MSASVPVKAGVAAAPRPHLGGSESGDPVVDVFIVVPKLVLSEPHPLHRLGGRAADETACGGGGGDEGNGDENDFIHTEQFVLIDKERRIRGFYDGTENEDINKIKKDLIILKREYD